MGISKNLLVHSCTVYTVTGRGADRKPTYDTGTTLNNVWLDFQTADVNGANGKEKSDSMILYYDVVSSTPANFTFVKNMKVVFNALEFFIDSIKPCYGLNGLAHYELGLK